MSFGAFELTIGVVPGVPTGDDVLSAVAEAGYDGIELGPPGYLGAGELLRRRLEALRLELAGAFIQIRFTEPQHWEEDFGLMETTLVQLAAAAHARPVLADAGSPARVAAPGRSATDRSFGLDKRGWQRLADGVARAADAARSRDLEPTFHHHAGTFVEAPWEIEQLLDLTDVGLLLDTGHLVVGNGDPVEAARAWHDRIDHVHVKDIRAASLQQAIERGEGVPEIWRRGVFCELGAGDIDLEGFFAELEGYSGWLVVEQDVIPTPDNDVADVMSAQTRNRNWIREHVGV